MTDILTLDDEADSFEQIGAAAARVVDKIAPLGPVEKIPITSREQWIDTRRRYVTASDIASICGVGRRSPLQVWAEKTGVTPPTADNKVMRKGRWFEPAIFEALAELHPDWAVRRAKVFLAANDHRIGATPDGVASIPGVDGIVIIQGKVVARPVFREKWLADSDDDFSPATAPFEYQLQTLTEAMLAGATTAYIAALVHDTYTADLVLVPVERHAAAEQRILDRVGRFWADLDAGREPSVMPEKDADIIKALYPVDDGEEIDLSGDNSIPGLLAERDDLGETLKLAGDRKKAIETEIKAKLGSASSARVADGRRITHRLQRRAGYEVKPSEFRVLRVAKG